MSRTIRLWQLSPIRRQMSSLAPLIALVVLALSCAAPDTARAEPVGQTVTYYNHKFGFALGLPVEIFEPTASKTQADGSLWASRDGRARLLAVAAANEAGTSLSAYRAFVMQQSYPNAQFDYAPMRDNWFVLSGRRDGDMFYERITFACEGRYIYGWQVTYPVAERRRYDAVVEALHRSYRAGRGEDGRCGRVP